VVAEYDVNTPTEDRVAEVLRDAEAAAAFSAL
jgi:hypothetical protein